MMNPSISCICPTFGRLELLEESLECFLRQDYDGQKELLIINDQPGVEYRFEHPEVKILNTKERFNNLGEKMNFSRRLRKYEVMVPWPDDDIHLPHTLTTYADGLGGNDCYYFSGYWFALGNKIDKWVYGSACGMIILKSEFFDKTGGYPSLSVAEDVGMRHIIHLLNGKTRTETISPENGFFVYRWGTGYYHISGIDPKKAWDYCGAEADKNLPSGIYYLNPNWKENYIELCREYGKKV
jgi:glycosyltransferase involved in cell wall biosynthesis